MRTSGAGTALCCHCSRVSWALAYPVCGRWKKLMCGWWQRCCNWWGVWKRKGCNRKDWGRREEFVGMEIWISRWGTRMWEGTEKPETQNGGVERREECLQIKTRTTIIDTGSCQPKHVHRRELRYMTCIVIFSLWKLSYTGTISLHGCNITARVQYLYVSQFVNAAVMCWSISTAINVISPGRTQANQVSVHSLSCRSSFHQLPLQSCSQLCLFKLHNASRT